MTTYHHREQISPLRDKLDVKLPASAYLRHAQRADGWSAGRQGVCLARLADGGMWQCRHGAADRRLGVNLVSTSAQTGSLGQLST
jgi:hypothetical protein